MTGAAQKVLESLDSLPEPDQDEVVAEILRRISHSHHTAPFDGDLVAAADAVFLQLDQLEAKG